MKESPQILADLVATTPGEEGKWFAMAKDLKLYDLALELANRTPCDPKTLTRAARDYVDTELTFALVSAMAALRWLSEGWGYEVTSGDVMEYSGEITNSPGTGIFVVFRRNCLNHYCFRPAYFPSLLLKA
ncbi:MAG: hypothetical protein KZQ88_08765 [Candidatus Thiodiazotropha sp. (ex Dulcina madagascariensis)]|nr:hypothetical protein [Candidatus Thiodiazotropha sp. (ex Dulcina madagascariensis)]MCU7928181.1 hypothetical protein [Candidatus Thiodiazotropha sp. (ex Dulcina madagascariensis)]